MEMLRHVFYQQDTSSGMDPVPVSGPLLNQELRRCQEQNLRPGIALGAFGLIHAGTVSFLRQARQECDCLFALILPQTDFSAPQLLKPEERIRLLNSLQEVDGSFLIGSSTLNIEECMAAAQDLPWFTSQSEEDIDPATFSALHRKGISIRQMAGSETCTTQALLRRMARGKAAGSG